MEERFLNDNELLYLYHQGDEEALALLIEKYRRIMGAYARGYSGKVKTSCEVSDIYQLALISLYNAVNSYKENMGCRFSSYFKIVMERSIYNYIRHIYSDVCRANREAISIDQLVNDYEGIYVVDTIACEQRKSDPCWNVNIKDMMCNVNRIVEALSPEEQKIYRLWEKGFSYREIAVLVEETEKRVDNVLYKIKRLLREGIEEQKD